MAIKIKLRPGAKKSGSKSPTSATRKKLAASDKAMPGGRYPIPNVDFLKRAIRSIGRTPPDKRPAVVAWIKKRASALGQPQLAANLSNAADMALELANSKDALELAGVIVTPPELTPGARSLKSGKGKIPGLKNQDKDVKGKGKEKEKGNPPEPMEAAGNKLGLKNKQAVQVYGKLRKAGKPHSIAHVAAKMVDKKLGSPKAPRS